jgi:hypothetical protein
MGIKPRRYLCDKFPFCKMENIVSIPDELYQEAKSQADYRGVTVDDFVIETLRGRLRKSPIKLSEAEMTEALNRVYGVEPQVIDPVLWALQTRALWLENDEW